MYAHDSKLLEAIRNFDIDGRNAALSFERRLARECGWTPAFAQRVVAEYRRFVYLAMTAGHPVTPSDEVDQAWHLHLVYTDSYWRRMCGVVLPRPLHHNPTAGGEREDAKFHDWYERTLASYRAAFDQEPDPEVWPPACQRFAPHRQFRRVRNVEWLLIPKTTIRRVAVVGATVAATPLLAGATLLGAGQSDGSTLVIVIIIIALFIALIGLAAAAATRGLQTSRRSTDRGCGGAYGGCGGGMHFGGGTLHDGGSDRSGSDAGGGGDGGGGGSDCGGGGCGGGGGGCGGGCGG